MLGAVAIYAVAFHIFHCHERPAELVDPGIIQTSDVRMFQRRENVSFARHAFGEAADPSDMRQFERNGSFEYSVCALRQPDASHTAAAQLSNESIAADL